MGIKTNTKPTPMTFETKCKRCSNVLMFLITCCLRASLRGCVDRTRRNMSSFCVATKKQGAMLLLLLFAVACSCVQACKYTQSGELMNTQLNKINPGLVPICLVINDRYQLTAEVIFDSFSRVVVRGSYEEVVINGACVNDNLWFPVTSCSAYNGPGIGNGAPTNYYVSVQGVSSSYRKRYAQMDTSAQGRVAAVLPLTTAVVQVDNGVVKSVYWSDGCFFNENRAKATDCIFNAFDLTNQIDPEQYNQFLNPTGETTLGYDTSLTPQQCTQQGNPPGFCDLGIYIVWTGTSLDGKQLVSANPRFSRFRDSFAMGNQFATMVNFNGHSFEKRNVTSTRSLTMRPTQ